MVNSNTPVVVRPPLVTITVDNVSTSTKRVDMTIRIMSNSGKYREFPISVLEGSNVDLEWEDYMVKKPREKK